MKKIPSLFVRDYERIITDFNPIAVSTMPDGSHSILSEVTKTRKGRFLATEQVTPGCEWVLAGEGVATRKWDGMAIKLHYSDTSFPVFMKRYDAKNGKTPPAGFAPCQDPDPVTGHWPGWIPAPLLHLENKWLSEASKNLFAACAPEWPEEGTYELVGPKINGNKDQLSNHQIIRHGYQLCEDCPSDFEGIKRYLNDGEPIEGVVFHHPDGRMCKIKRSDFGLKW